MTPDEAERLAAQQLVTAPNGDRCSAVLAEQWSESAPRCTETATRRVCTDSYASGFITAGEFYPAERLTNLCDSHDTQTHGEPGWHWSRPLAVRTDEMEA